MVNHYVFWNFKDSLTKEEREEAGNKIKELLEAVAYQVHPEHVKAGSYVGTVTTNRTCFDFEE